MKPRHLLIVTLAGCVLTSCGPAPKSNAPEPREADKVPAKPSFMGIPTSGSPVDAKAAGLTSCRPNGKDGYYGFYCEKPDAEIYGIKSLRAQVYLEYPSDLKYGEERKPESTSYKGFSFHFPDREEIEYGKCDYPDGNPFVCSKNPDSPLLHIANALIKDGWVGYTPRMSTRYSKVGVPYQIWMSTKGIPYEGADGENVQVVEVSVIPEDLEIVKENVEQARNQMAQESKGSVAADSFVKDMSR